MACTVEAHVGLDVTSTWRQRGNSSAKSPSKWGIQIEELGETSPAEVWNRVRLKLAKMRASSRKRASLQNVPAQRMSCRHGFGCSQDVVAAATEVEPSPRPNAGAVRCGWFRVQLVRTQSLHSGRAAVEGISPTSLRSHWIEPE